VAVLQQYGFTIFSGFLITALTISRLRCLQDEAPPFAA